MSKPSIIAVAGPCGSGKTTWIKQFLKDETTPLFYFYPGLDTSPVDLIRIGYCFPWVQVISDQQATAAALLATRRSQWCIWS